MALTPKQNIFVAEYLVDGNATQAAIRAGYSSKTAASQAHDLLKKPEIATAIADAQKRRMARVELTQDDVLRELLTFAKVDVSQAFDFRGKLKPLREMPEDVRRAISALETRADGRLAKIRFWDKTKGLELLGKYLKMFSEKVEHNHTVAASIRVIDPYAEPPSDSVEKQEADPEKEP